MTDTRYSAEELREQADVVSGIVAEDAEEYGFESRVGLQTVAMLRQAARDAETLAGIRAWLEAQRDKAAEIAAVPFDWPTMKHGAMMTGSVLENGLRELDRLSRGDA